MFRRGTEWVKPSGYEMMDAFTGTTDAIERANAWYWGSSRSVNQIADDLDLSKGALYEMIQPLPAGLGCPLCGSEVVFSNRTAKEKSRLSCSTCDWDGVEGETVPYDGSAEDVPPPPPNAGLGGPADEGRGRTLAGGALLGAAAGLALVLWARRR
jgi:hypothetical protein